MPTKFWLKVTFLALPVAIQILLQALLGIADVAMVSGLGAEAVAAVGLASKLHFLILVFVIGVASAGAILTAQYAGAGDMPSCQRTIAVTLLVGAVLSLPFMAAFALGFIWLDLVNPDPNVVTLAISFLLITTPVVFITQIVVVYESCLRSIGNTMIALVIGVLVVNLNIFFNYILIFGQWGMPELGVDGAAWGTLLARILQLTAFFVWLYVRKHPFALKLSAFRAALTWGNLRSFIVFAIPIVLNHGVWGLGNACYHVATGFAGTQALAVMGAMAPIESAFFSIFIGLATACSVMVGQALGGNRPEEAWALHKIFDRAALFGVVALSVVLWLMRGYLVAGFKNVDSQTISLMMDTLTIFCFIVVVKVMNLMRILGVLRAGADNQFCLMVDTAAMWVFSLPVFIFGLYSGWPFLVLYALMGLEDTLKLLPVKFRIHKRIWIKNLTHSY